MTALQALRIFGPCSVAVVSKHTRLAPRVVEDDLEVLANDEFAAKRPDGLWDITTQGILEFEAACERQKRQALDAACEGVR